MFHRRTEMMTRTVMMKYLKTLIFVVSHLKKKYNDAKIFRSLECLNLYFMGVEGRVHILASH